MNHLTQIKTVWITATVVLLLQACGGGVTLAEVQSQEEDARKELQQAQEALIKLTELKESYSVDSRDARVKELEAKQKQLKKDIKSLQGVSSANAEEAASDMAKNLKNEVDKIENQIEELNAISKESWEAARTAINDRISALQQQINEITANLTSQIEGGEAQ